MWEVIRDTFNKKLTKQRSIALSPRTPEAGDTYFRYNFAKTEVNFKDLNLSIDEEVEADDDDDDEEFHPIDEVEVEKSIMSTADSTNKADILGQVIVSRKTVLKNKLVIILVGLPGRGKTFLCNKLKCYLNWLGHHTGHFNVGNYRRKHKSSNEVQDAGFFDAKNPAGMEARERALHAALEDLLMYLQSDKGQVAIFDATNTTEARRRLLINTFHGKVQYLFIESICNDPKVLEANYKYKMMYSPDYAGMTTEQALNDFKHRILKYEEVYEEITDRNLHYIKLINMVTGRGYMDINRISGYIPGKIVFFLMQVCKAGITQARKIWLTRHGESEWNVLGKLGGDSNLSSHGADYAKVLPDMVLKQLVPVEDGNPIPVSVWTSTLKRTIQTASLLPFPKLRWKALDEIHAGVCDGMTYEEINEKFPEDFEARKKDKLRYRYPAGESYLDVIQRLEPVVIEVEREKECVLIVAHQAILRCIYGYFTATPPNEIPLLEIPLHTLIELRPRSDGTMEVQELKASVGIDRHMMETTKGSGSPVTPRDADATVSPFSQGAMQELSFSGGLLPSAPVPLPTPPVNRYTQTHNTTFKQLPAIKTSPAPSPPRSAFAGASCSSAGILSPPPAAAHQAHAATSTEGSCL